MFNLADSQFQERLVQALNSSAAFAHETRWFDGSILLEADDKQCWLKIYRGRVIEALAFVTPLGYTFKISGPAQRWEQFISGQRTFADLITPGSRYFASKAELEQANPFHPADVKVEGNTMEANRIHEALYHLADCIATSAR